MWSYRKRIWMLLSGSRDHIVAGSLGSRARLPQDIRNYQYSHVGWDPIGKLPALQNLIQVHWNACPQGLCTLPLALKNLSCPQYCLPSRTFWSGATSRWIRDLKCVQYPWEYNKTNLRQPRETWGEWGLKYFYEFVRYGTMSTWRKVGKLDRDRVELKWKGKEWVRGLVL